jgi:RHS repeat-associated protein
VNADGVLDDSDEILFFACNRRGDVFAAFEAVTHDANGNRLPKAEARLAAWMNYSPYGEPMIFDPADFNRSGEVDALDRFEFDAAYAGPIDINDPAKFMNALADVNFDGDRDATDEAQFNAAWLLASTDGAASERLELNILYAGYWYDPHLGLYHVRHRVFDPARGRWMQRDPIGYLGGPNLYAYVSGEPMGYVDPMGLDAYWLGDALRHIGLTGLGEYADNFADGTVEAAETIAQSPWAFARGARNGFLIGAASTVLFTAVATVASPIVIAAVVVAATVYAVYQVSALGAHWNDLAKEDRAASLGEFVGATAGGVIGARGAGRATRSPFSKPTQATPQLAGTQRSTARGDIYSVAFEMKLDPAVIGKGRPVHFNRANAALDSCLQSDRAFASRMERLIPGVSSSVSKAGGRTTPTGWVWHHATELGTMQLVPELQHTPGSRFWSTMHPNGRGGYAIWAIPAGAPSN